MTERENLELVFTPGAKPAWIPYMFTAYNFIIPTDVIADRPPFGVERGNDWFGVIWVWDAATNGFVQDPKAPLVCDDVTKWREQVKFPDLDAIDWEAAAAPVVAGYDPNRWTQLMLQCGIFERTHSLLGFENTFIAMYEEPEALHELMSAITDHRIEVMKRAVRYFRPELITNMDDYGAQNGPLMSNEMFRTHILPHGKRLGQALKELNVIYQHHSCGTWDRLAPDMVEMGMKSMTAVAPTNQVDQLIHDYGDWMVFDGGMNILGVLDYRSSSFNAAQISTLGFTFHQVDIRLDPHPDPRQETNRRKQRSEWNHFHSEVGTTRSIRTRKRVVVFLYGYSHAGGHWCESSSLHQLRSPPHGTSLRLSAKSLSQTGDFFASPRDPLRWARAGTPVQLLKMTVSKVF